MRCLHLLKINNLISHLQWPAFILSVQRTRSHKCSAGVVLRGGSGKKGSVLYNCLQEGWGMETQPKISPWMSVSETSHYGWGFSSQHLMRWRLSTICTKTTCFTESVQSDMATKSPSFNAFACTCTFESCIALAHQHSTFIIIYFN